MAIIEPLARRVAVLGWHTQFNMSGEQIVELTDVRRRLPTQIVFDHLASPPLPAGITHPSHGIVRELLDRGRAGAPGVEQRLAALEPARRS